jgi:hypothetical protein
MAFRQGVAAFDFGDGAGNPGVQGSSLDAAFVIGNRGSVGWKNGIYLTTNVTQTTGSFPLSSDGCILCMDAIGAAAGIDMFNLTLTSPSTQYILRGSNGTFLLTGNGDVDANAIEAQGGLISNAAHGSNAVIQLRDAETPIWSIIREATTDDLIFQSAGPTTRFRINNTTVGSITGGLCFDGGTSTVIFKVGANCI